MKAMPAINRDQSVLQHALPAGAEKSLCEEAWKYFLILCSLLCHFQFSNTFLHEILLLATGHVLDVNLNQVLFY